MDASGSVTRSSGEVRVTRDADRCCMLGGRIAQSSKGVADFLCEFL